MSSEENIQQAADRLWQAWQAGETTAPIRDLLDEGDVAAAYAVQEINTRRWLGGEERQLSGRKIGLTSKAVQKQLGVGQPDYGMLFADMEVMDGEEIAFARVMQPKVEAEIAFIMGDDLNADTLTSADILASVAYAVAAIEACAFISSMKPRVALVMRSAKMIQKSSHEPSTAERRPAISIIAGIAPTNCLANIFQSCTQKRAPRGARWKK